MSKLSKSIIFLLLTLVLFSLYSKTASDNIIQAGGYVKHNKEKISGVSIKIYENSTLTDQLVTDRIGRYGFSLDFNKQYRIEFAKEGFIKTTILIDTEAPVEVVNSKEAIPWQPEFLMYKLMPGMDMDQLIKPIRKFMYSDWFIIEDEKYKAEVLPVIEELKKEITKRKEIALVKEKNRADSLLNLENYEEAIIAYNNTLKLNNAEKQAVKQIKKAKKELKKEKSKEEGYLESVRLGDEKLLEGLFEEAQQLYQKALIYKPKEVYPLDKLYEIDSISSYRWIAKNNRYENFLIKADTFFATQSYDSAKWYYTSAYNVFNKDYPLQMISQLEKLKQQQDSIVQDSINRINAFNDSINKIQADTAIGNSESKILSKISQTFRRDKNPVDSVELDSSNVVENMAEIQKATKNDETVDSTEPSIKELNEKALIEKEIDSISSDEAVEIFLEDFMPNANKKLAFTSINTEESLVKLQKELEEEIEINDKKAASATLEEIGLIYQTEFRLGDALESYEKSLTLKRATNDKKGESKILSNIATVMYDSGNYDKAIETFEESIEIAKEIDDKEQATDALLNMATVFENTYQYDEAIELLSKSIELKHDLGDIESTGEIRRSIGNIYYEQQNFEKAVEELEKSLEIEEQQEDTEDITTTLNNIGAVYYNMDDLTKAQDFYERSLEITEQSNNQHEKSISLNNLGNIKFSSKQYNRAIEFYEQSLKVKKEIDFQGGIATTLYNMGNTYYEMKEYEKALEYFQASMDLAIKEKYKEIEWQNYEALAKTYSAMGNFKNAYSYYKKYTFSKYEIFSSNKQLTELREQYESSKIAVKQLKVELQKQNREARYEMKIIRTEMALQEEQLTRQKNVIISFIVGSLIILLFAFIVTRQYQQKNKAYKIVAEQKKHIMDGIAYAQRIQSAVLPPQKFISSIVSNYFVLYKPREVVSGDFYWVAKHYNKNIIAVSDCTGHGVPGGFMSMLGIAFLNEIISIERPIDTNEILDQLRDRVMDALHQETKESDTMDGMDITIISIDPEKNELQFSGAYHTLYYIRNNEINMLKGDRQPIGFHFRKKPFTSKSLQLEKGDMLYMTSDGIIDQIGEKTMNRFMAGSFRELLLSIHNKPLEEQKQILDETHRNWKGTLEQTDDVLVFGIRI